MLVVFSHGKESGPDGSKILAMAKVAEKHKAEVRSIDYRGIDRPEDRVKHLLSSDIRQGDGLVLVGSSMGGYVSTIASRKLRPSALFLLAPAFGMKEYPESIPAPFARHKAVVHGVHDSIVDPVASIRWASEFGSELHLVDDDHRLNKKLSLVCALLDVFLTEVDSCTESR